MQKIIEYLKKYRPSTTDVADALGKTGLLSVARPITPGLYCVGSGHYTYACNNSNWMLHKMSQDAPAGSVVYVQVYDCGDKAVLGDLIAGYLFEKRHVAGVVVNGIVRDVGQLIEDRSQVWAKGISPIGVGHDEESMKCQIDEGTLVNEGILVCDDTGVVIISRSSQDGILEKLEHIRQREMRWHREVSEGKTTFEVVCKSA